jgi:hypothetical protein
MKMLAHEFWLLAETSEDYADWCEGIGRPADVALQDDIVQYVSDTLRWIPSINPANPTEWSGFGLNYYGTTVINSVGAPAAARILRNWATLFFEGPPEFELRGSYEWTEGDSVEAGAYERIVVDRDETVHSLNLLADMADQIRAGTCLLHRGV